MQVLGIDRVVIAVPDVTEAAQRFSELLDISFGKMLHARTDSEGRIRPDGEPTIESRISSEADIDIIAPAEADGNVATFLHRNRPGIFAITFRVADLDAAREHLADHDVYPIAHMNWGTFSEHFYDPADFGGAYVLLSEFPHAVETNYHEVEK